MKSGFLLISILGSALLTAAHPTFAVDAPKQLDINLNCELVVPPDGAAKQTTPHAGSFYVYPKPLPDKYTGCQIVWIEKHKMVTSRFSDGEVQSVDVVEPKGREFHCRYANKKLISEEPKGKCPSPEEAAW